VTVDGPPVTSGPVTAAPVAVVTAFLAAWSTGEPARRLEQLRGACTEDVVYRDPGAAARGVVALSAHIAQVRSEFSDHQIVLTSGVDGHHGVVRFGWTAYQPDGRAALHGTDTAELSDDGRLCSIAAFFGPLPPRSYTFVGR
jgi:hypothetical protein